jgi:predicted CXXCH cytochrome family protein
MLKKKPRGNRSYAALSCYMIRMLKAALATFLGAVCLVWLTGCATTSSGEPGLGYKVLSFFFDGVPLPVSQDQNAQQNQGGQGAARPELGKYAEHGPFAAKLCRACHQQGTNDLVLPIKELCVNCHALNIKKRYVHGPVASGDCKVCHEPHGSAYRFFLVDEPKKFCFYCHKQKDILKREVHQSSTEMQCTECHNAHASNVEFLLK